MSRGHLDELHGRVFISYVHEDRGRVDRLQAALEGAGISVWRDMAKISAGQDWGLEIRDAIRAGCLVFIACFSENSERRETSYRNEELTLAVEQMRARQSGLPWLIPLRFAECSIPAFDLGAGRMLDSMQRIDLFDDSWEQAGPLVIGAVSRILDSRPTAPVRDRAADETEQRPPRKAWLGAARVLDDAERTVQLITSECWKAATLARVANALAAIDPDRAAWMSADAERMAQSITDKESKASALENLAKTLASFDPDRAERIAESITDQDRKAATMADIAKALAAIDPDRAAQLFADAERIAGDRSYPMMMIAQALTSFDPYRAERTAHSITEQFWQAWALAHIAKALAATKPDRAARLFADAECIAQSITDDWEKPSMLDTVARAVAASDPDRAERIARSITDPDMKAGAMRSVVSAVAATDPDRAERIAWSITNMLWRARALVAVAEAQP